MRFAHMPPKEYRLLHLHQNLHRSAKWHFCSEISYSSRRRCWMLLYRFIVGRCSSPRVRQCRMSNHHWRPTWLRNVCLRFGRKLVDWWRELTIGSSSWVDGWVHSILRRNGSHYNSLSCLESENADWSIAKSIKNKRHCFHAAHYCQIRGPSSQNAGWSTFAAINLWGIGVIEEIGDDKIGLSICVDVALIKDQVHGIISWRVADEGGEMVNWVTEKAVVY